MIQVIFGDLCNNLLKCIEYFRKYDILKILCLQLTIKSTSEEKRMKKSYSLLSCFALFLLSLVLFCKPVKAAEPTVINLSDLEEDRELQLVGDTILNLDTDKTIAHINAYDHELTISGSGTVRCNRIWADASGKVIIDSGTIVCKGYLDGEGILVINDGSITAQSLDMNYITINGGNIHAQRINAVYGEDSALSIYGGHVELTGLIRKRKIYIDDKMFVAEPWNKEPEPEEDDDQFILYNINGVKLMPRSEVVSLDEISISETSCSLDQGEKKQLSVKFSPENATNKIVRWFSSNPTVVRVNRYEGVIEALNPGKAIITAISESGEHTQTCEVIVPDTGISQDGLVIEASTLNWGDDENQPYIKVKYNGVELKEGSDYAVNKNYNNNTRISVATITGLDEYIRNIDKK